MTHMKYYDEKKLFNVKEKKENDSFASTLFFFAS
jgi:hypothetical protein